MMGTTIRTVHQPQPASPAPLLPKILPAVAPIVDAFLSTSQYLSKALP
ncbi:hypothetical protein ABID59_001833 [Bradyrhizobium sp. S3.3.6]